MDFLYRPKTGCLPGSSLIFGKKSIFNFVPRCSYKREQNEHSRLFISSRFIYLIKCVVLCVCRTLGSAVGLCGARSDARLLLLLWTAGMWDTRRILEERRGRTVSWQRYKKQDASSLTWFTACEGQEASSRYYVAALCVRACGSERATI